MQNSRASQTNKLLLYISLSICLGVLIGTQITGLDAEKTFFNKNIAGKNYTYLVIGNKELIDMDILKEMGEFQELTLEEIFGY